MTIEVGHHSIKKHGQPVCGDVFNSVRVPGDGRVLSVLADGMGSGIKASVLAGLTASMAITYGREELDIIRATETILRSLPVCQERGLGYSTLTLMDIDPLGRVRVAGHGNPSPLWLRGHTKLPWVETTQALKSNADISLSLTMGIGQAKVGDHFIIMSDGVTQAGLASGKGLPLGWGESGVYRHAATLLYETPDISPKNLAISIAEAASAIDNGVAGDDISVAVMHYREPRKMLLLTGPPYAEERDAEMAAWARTFEGCKAICGGTTASLVARELGLSLQMNQEYHTEWQEPPSFLMNGFDLVSEGTLTLGRLAERLTNNEESDKSPSGRLCKLLLENDEIDIVVGMKVNAAHHDPELPREIDIRRNIIRRIENILTTRHLKEVRVNYL